MKATHHAVYIGGLSTDAGLFLSEGCARDGLFLIGWSGLIDRPHLITSHAACIVGLAAAAAAGVGLKACSAPAPRAPHPQH